MKPASTARAILILPLALALTPGCAFRTPTPRVPVEIAGDAGAPMRFNVAEVKVVAQSGTIDAGTAAAVRAQTDLRPGTEARPRGRPRSGARQRHGYRVIALTVAGIVQIVPPIRPFPGGTSTRASRPPATPK